MYIYISNDEALSSGAQDKDHIKSTTSQSSSIYSFAKTLKERYSLFARSKLGLLLKTTLSGLFRNNVGGFRARKILPICKIQTWSALADNSFRSL